MAAGVAGWGVEAESPRMPLMWSRWSPRLATSSSSAALSGSSSLGAKVELARRPAGKEAAVGAGKTGGDVPQGEGEAKDRVFQHQPGERAGAGSSGFVLSRSYLEQGKIPPESRPAPSELDHPC